MTVTTSNIQENKWQVTVSFLDEGVDAQAQNVVIGTQEQAVAYGATLARDFRENNKELFPPEEIEEIEEDEVL